MGTEGKGRLGKLYKLKYDQSKRFKTLTALISFFYRLSKKTYNDPYRV